jgi:hypothetical protein
MSRITKFQYEKARLIIEAYEKQEPKEAIKPIIFKIDNKTFVDLFSVLNIRSINFLQAYFYDNFDQKLDNRKFDVELFKLIDFNKARYQNFGTKSLRELQAVMEQFI